MGNESEVGVSEYMLWHNHEQTSWRQFPWNSLKTFDARNPRWDTKEVPKTGRNLCLVGIISIVLTTETLLAFASFVEFVTYKFRKLCIDFGFERVWKHLKALRRWDFGTWQVGILPFLPVPGLPLSGFGTCQTWRLATGPVGWLVRVFKVKIQWQCSFSLHWLVREGSKKPTVVVDWNDNK